MSNIVNYDIAMYQFNNKNHTAYKYAYFTVLVDVCGLTGNRAQYICTESGQAIY